MLLKTAAVSVAFELLNMDFQTRRADNTDNSPHW